jgi:hypothetical protein
LGKKVKKKKGKEKEDGESDEKGKTIEEDDIRRGDIWEIWEIWEKGKRKMM